MFDLPFFKIFPLKSLDLISNSSLTADVLVSQVNLLSDQEARLGFQLDLDCSRILDKQRKQIAFYLTLPNVSIVNAMYLAKSFPSIQSAICSSWDDLRVKARLNDRRAKKLWHFLNELV